LTWTAAPKLVDLGDQERISRISISGSAEEGFVLRMGKHWQKISVQEAGSYSPGFEGIVAERKILYFVSE
jgi:hypothetical protein